MLPADQCCGECIYWKETNGDDGQCRARPPHVVVVQQMVYQKGVTKSSLLSGTVPQEREVTQLQNQVITVFPMMKRDDPGCGVFDNFDYDDEELFDDED